MTNLKELSAELDKIEAGKSVQISFKSKGQDMVVEGVAKPKQ